MNIKYQRSRRKVHKKGQNNEIFSNKNVSIAQQNLLNKTINKKSSYSNWPVDYFIKIKISPNIRQIIIQRIIYFNELIEITLLLFARYIYSNALVKMKKKKYIRESNLQPSACKTTEQTFRLNQLSDINNKKR